MENASGVAPHKLQLTNAAPTSETSDLNQGMQCTCTNFIDLKGICPSRSQVKVQRSSRAIIYRKDIDIVHLISKSTSVSPQTTWVALSNLLQRDELNAYPIF